jgi:PEP-CTERM motif
MKTNLVRSAVLVIAVFAVLAMAGPSRADNVFIMRTGPTGFNAAVGPNQFTIDFQGPTTQFVAPYTNSGVTFTGQNSQDVAIIDGSNASLPGEFLLTTYCQGVNSPPCDTNQAMIVSLLLSLPPGTTAIGFDLADSNSGQPLGTQDTYLVCDSNGTCVSVTPPNFGSFAFIGFQISGSSTSISSVTIERLTSFPNGQALIDNVSVAPTPEPGTLALFGSGLLGVGSLLRRRRAQNNASSAER